MPTIRILFVFRTSGTIKFNEVSPLKKGFLSEESIVSYPVIHQEHNKEDQKNMLATQVCKQEYALVLSPVLKSDQQTDLGLDAFSQRSWNNQKGID